MEFDIPDRKIFIPELNELPKDWDAIPPLHASQAYGTQLLKTGLLCFGVPSVVDKTSLNFIINPLSENFSVVTYKVYSLDLDQRLIR
jgi:hypothetical protein